MAESIFKVKVSNGLINIELEGKSEIVIEQFNEIRRTGLENFLTGGAKEKPAKQVVTETTGTDIPVKKKRGRKPKAAVAVANEVTPVVEKKQETRGRKKKVVEQPADAVAVAPKKRGRPRKNAVAAEVVAAPKKLEKAPKKGKTVKSIEQIIKALKSKTPKKKKEEPAKVDVNLNAMPSLEDVCKRTLPGPEREWILTYALYASDFGKKTITRDDIVLKYEETGRKDQSKINNLTNNITNAIKKGWIVNPEDKKLYITAEGITMAYTIATRTTPVKEKKTGKAPKKLRSTAPVQKAPAKAAEADSQPAAETPSADAQKVIMTVKKAKAKTVKKAKAKKKAVKKPAKKAEPVAETEPTPAAETPAFE